MNDDRQITAESRQKFHNSLRKLRSFSTYVHQIFTQCIEPLPSLLMCALIFRTLEQRVKVVNFDFLARDVIYTSRAYVMMPVRLSVCLSVCLLLGGAVLLAGESSRAMLDSLVDVCKKPLNLLVAIATTFGLRQTLSQINNRHICMSTNSDKRA